MNSTTSSPLILEACKCYTFAEDVLTSRIVSGKRRKQACQRFLDDLARMNDPEYPWTFDIRKGYRPIEFIERFLKPSKGNYSRMELLPWQHFVFANMYGWVSKKTGLRRFTEGLIIVGSGNGKSTMIAGLAAYMASKDGERGAECYMLANSKDQARITYDECKAQIEKSPKIRKKFRRTRDGIYYDKTQSKIQALASDSTNVDGRNVHFAVFDELQDYTDYKLIGRIKKKTVKRDQALIVYITTLGTVLDGPCMDYYVLGGNILDQSDAISQRAADRMFVYIDEIDEDDDPADYRKWIKANPSMGVLLKLDDLIDQWERVKVIPAERSDFINKQLNVFTQVDELSFLDMATIKKNNRTYPLEQLLGRRCFGGFDLSEREDFTSVCLEFPLDDGDFFVLEHTWVPKTKTETDNEKLDWHGLQEEGLLTIVDGPYVDYQLIFDWFEEQRAKYIIEAVGFDSAKAFLLVNQMTASGYLMEEVRQGQYTLTDPLDDLKVRYLDGKIVHNNSRLYSWYLGNVRLTKRNHTATYLPTKMNRYRKIDGFACHLNAHTIWMRRAPRVIPPNKKLSTVIKLGGA